MGKAIVKRSLILLVVLLISITIGLGVLVGVDLTRFNKNTTLDSVLNQGSNDSNIGYKISNNEELESWIKNPFSDAYLLSGQLYKVELKTFSESSLGKVLHGNNAIIQMTGLIDVNSINKDTAIYGLLFRNIISGGAIEDVKFINNVNFTMTILQDHYWRGNGDKGQSTFYIGGVVGELANGALLDNCTLEHRGRIEIRNQAQTTNPNVLNPLYIGIRLGGLVGKASGKIVTCTVNMIGELYANMTTPVEARGNWHMWGNYVSAVVGTLDSTGKLVNTTVSIQENSRLKSYGINQTETNACKVSFLIGEFAGGVINGVLFKNIPTKKTPNGENRFESSITYDNSGKNNIVNTNTYIAVSKVNSGTVANNYLYTENIDNIGEYSINEGATSAYTYINPKYYPQYVKGKETTIRLNLASECPKEQIVWSINNETCYEQTSNTFIDSKKWKAISFNDIRLVFGDVRSTRLTVQTDLAKVYDGNKITDFGNLIRLAKLDSNGLDVGAFDKSKYIPIFNNSEVRNAGEYTLLGIELIGDPVYPNILLAENRQVWTVDRIEIGKDVDGVLKDKLHIERRPIKMAVKNGMVYKASIKVDEMSTDTGLVNGDVIRFSNGVDKYLSLSNNNSEYLIGDIDFSGRYSANQSIDINYKLRNDIDIAVTPHIIQLPQDIKLVNDSSLSVENNRLTINQVVDSIQLLAQSKEYGYEYSNWTCWNSNVLAERCKIEVLESTNILSKVKISNIGEMNKVEILYRQKSLGISVIPTPEIQVTIKANNQVVSAGDKACFFGDRLTFDAGTTNENIEFAYWEDNLGNVLSYEKIFHTVAFQNVQIKAVFMAKLNEKTAKIIFLDIAGKVMCERKVPEGKLLGRYLRREAIEYNYYELHKTFIKWDTKADINKELKVGDVVEVYPVFETDVKVGINDETHTLKQKYYNFNDVVTLPEGKYNINGVNINAPKEGYKFSAINSITIKRPQLEGQTTSTVIKMDYARNARYMLATVVSNVELMPNFKMLISNGKDKDDLDYKSKDVNIQRFAVFGNGQNGYIYQFIVQVKSEISNFIGDNMSIQLMNGNKEIGRV